MMMIVVFVCVCFCRVWMMIFVVVGFRFFVGLLVRMMLGVWRRVW